MILEFKTTVDTREVEDLIRQAGQYIKTCIEDPVFEEIHYAFQLDQNNEVPQEGMKGLYLALNEFLNTGKLKLPDGTVLLDMNLKEANKILKVLTWGGGYLP